MQLHAYVAMMLYGRILSTSHGCRLHSTYSIIRTYPRPFMHATCHALQGQVNISLAQFPPSHTLFMYTYYSFIALNLCSILSVSSVNSQFCQFCQFSILSILNSVFHVYILFIYSFKFKLNSVSILSRSFIHASHAVISSSSSYNISPDQFTHSHASFCT